jgi:light-harvesting protein B-800-850 beta chain
LNSSYKNDRLAGGSGCAGINPVQAVRAGGRSSTRPSKAATTTGTEEHFMSNDPDKVWPTGLTLREAEEVHSYLIDGTRVFGVIALIAHVLVAVSTPWLG